MRTQAPAASLLLALGLLAGILVAAPSASAEPAECNDGVDNDDDGFTDHPNDPNCASLEDVDENGQCQDGNDNDGDGYIDFPGDPECETPEHHDESCPPRAVCDAFTTHVTVRYELETNEFTGRLAVPRYECRRGREVVIKRVRPARDEAVGSVLTDRRGRYRLETFGRIRGRFYARVPQQQAKARDSDVRFQCPGDRSVTIRVS